MVGLILMLATGLVFLHTASFLHILEINNFIIVIFSQSSQYHDHLSMELVNDLQNQTLKLSNQSFSYKRFTELNDVGSWTILPLLPKLHKLYSKKADWIVFCEDRTRFNIENLANVLSKYNSNEPQWIGYALHDREATIIHHFAFYEHPEDFHYPNLASGTVLSNKLLNHLSKVLNSSKYIKKTDFTIDASHEFALFIWDKGKGYGLIHNNDFCIQNAENCATYVQTFKPCTNDNLEEHDVVFAIKTCNKFHKDRISIVQQTWGQYATNKYFFSDIKDVHIPTIQLPSSNVEEGHCQKTKDILIYLSKILMHHPPKWVVIADDDTILSVGRLHNLLTCYNSSKSIAIGQRYGYNVLNSGGFNYITGGGGIVFSWQALKILTKSGACDCPTNTTPDDMYIFGVCLLRLKIPIIHSGMFHQARPTDYAPEYLLSDIAISFHKHWMIDPISVYKEWFEDADRLYNKTIMNKVANHDEL